jgi:acyl carrier protein
MEQSAIIEELKSFFIDELFVDLSASEIKADMRLRDHLGIDSLGFTELLAYIEDQYQISVEEEEFIPENFRTIYSIVRFIESKTANANIS